MSLKRLPCRTILNMMVLTGCMATFMLRINISIAIVSMPNMASTTTPITPSNVTSTTPQPSTNNSTNETVQLKQDNTIEGYPHYDPWQKNMILGCFFWGYIISEVPGGRLAEMFGTRLIFGISMLISSILTILVPPVSQYTSYYGLICVRVLQGVAMGAVFPSLYPLAAKWIPPMERSKFMSHILALSLGAAVTYPLCGFLISHLGWRSVFYVTGCLGLIWTAAWFLLVYDTPALHPRISPKERLRIEGLIGPTATNKVNSVPWGKLLTSPPVWAIILTHTANVFCYSTVSLQMPTFLNQVLSLDIKTNGIYSSLPQLGKYAMGLSAGYIAYFLLSRQILSTINVRRLFTGVATGIPGIMMILQAYTGYMTGWSVFNLVIAMTFNGAVTGGHLCSGLDITPNFAGTIFGLANTIGSLASFMSSVIIGHLTYELQTFSQWRLVFWLLGGSYILAALFFLTLGSADLQDWNLPRVTKCSLEEQEGKPLQEIKRPSSYINEAG